PLHPVALRDPRVFENGAIEIRAMRPAQDVASAAPHSRRPSPIPVEAVLTVSRGASWRILRSRAGSGVNGSPPGRGLGDAAPVHVRQPFRAEFFNAFNHPQFDLPNATIGSAAAGVISSTGRLSSRYPTEPEVVVLIRIIKRDQSERSSRWWDYQNSANPD